jgi:acetyl-CoA acyltransferase
MTTTLHDLEQTGGRYGLQTMCEAGGMANATVVPEFPARYVWLA